MLVVANFAKWCKNLKNYCYHEYSSERTQRELRRFCQNCQDLLAAGSINGLITVITLIHKYDLENISGDILIRIRNHLVFGLE